MFYNLEVRSQGCSTFLKFNSNEHVLYLIHKYLPTNVGISQFDSRANLMPIYGDLYQIKL